VSTEYFKNAKHPRVVVLINDKRVKVEGAEITTSTFYISDTYSIDLPILGQPKGIDLPFFLSDQKFTCKIYAGFPKDWDNFTEKDLDLMIIGDSNEVEIDMFTNSVHITGRDLSSRLIDSKITKTFSNNTASQIAKIFADSNGLKTRITESSRILGSFYQTQQTIVSNNTTQWDLLCNAAQQINFVVFVENETLVFEPRPDNNSKNIYTLKFQPPSGDVYSAIYKGTALKVYKNSGLTGNISVKVRVPYSTKTGEYFSVKVSSKNKVGQVGAAGTKKYVYSFPGLTREQANQRANQILRDLTIHGIRIETMIPGDNAIKKDTILKLTGTGTEADQVYFPDQIIRRIGYSSGGYSMEISAKNKPDNVELENQ
jgi:phage protein D